VPFPSFIQVDPAWFEYPTFNVADIAIAVGVGLLLLDGVKSPKGAEAPGGEPTST
jgi:lipoprotein signal peptidase